MGLYLPWAEAEVPGLEATYTIVHPGKMVRVNDRTSPERYEVDQVDGIFDTPAIREARQANSGDHGSSRGKRLLDDRIVALTGKTVAGSFKRMREMQRDLSRLGGVNWREGGVNFLPYIQIDVVDVYGLANFGTSLWINWVLDPDFADATKWANVGGSSVTFTFGDASQFIISANKYAYGNTSARVIATAGIGATHRVKGSAGITSFPIVANSPWSLTALARIISRTGTATLSAELLWYDAAGNLISTSLATGASALGILRSTVAASAPNGAVYLEYAITISGGASGGTIEYYVTNAMLLDGLSITRNYIGPSVPGCKPSSSAYYSQLSSYGMGPRPHNHTPNPSNAYNPATASTNATLTIAERGGFRDARLLREWSIGLEPAESSGKSSDSRDFPLLPSPAFYATASSAADMSVNDPILPVVPTQLYAYSGYFQPAAGGAARSVRITIVYRDATGGVLSTVNSTSVLESATAPVWVYFEHTAPANAFGVTASWVVLAPASGEKHLISARRSTTGSHTEPADGDYPGWVWMGTKGNSGSQVSPPESYVVEKIDVDVKQIEKQDSPHRHRPFMITARARDPRIYRVRRDTLLVPAALTGAAYIIQPNPGTFANTIAHEDAGVTVATAGGYTTITLSPAGTKNTIRIPNASVASATRFGQVHAIFAGGSPGAQSTNTAIAVVIRKVSATTWIEAIITSSGYAAIRATNDTGATYTAITATGFSNPVQLDREFWVKAYVDAGNVVRVEYFLQRPAPGRVPESSAAYTLTGGEITTFGTAVATGKTGWGIALDGAVANQAQPLLFEWEEGDISGNTLINGTANVEGDIDTPVKFVMKGPAVYPYIQASASGLVVYTDLVIATGETVTINEDGSIVGVGAGVAGASQANILSGTKIVNLLPLSQVVYFGGQGFVQAVTSLETSWRAAQQ